MAAVVIPASYYDPQDDLRRLAGYLNQKYGSLEKALGQFNPLAKLSLLEFEGLLKRWGLSQEVDCIQLFDYIDDDGSETVDVQELFRVLSLPVQQLQQRQEEQRQVALSHIFETMAKLIIVNYGSIEGYFSDLRRGRDAGGQTAGSVDKLSRAEFRRMVSHLGLEKALGGEELSARRLQCVFDEIDKDKSGYISVEELQKALCSYLVRNTLMSIGEFLTEQYGSVADAFSALQLGTLASPTGTTATPPGSVVGASVSPRTTPIGTLDELKALLLRLGKDLPTRCSDDLLNILLKSIQPFTSRSFESSIEKEYCAASQLRKQKEELVKAREEAMKKHKSLGYYEGTRNRAERAIDAWAKKALTQPSELGAGSVTAGWEKLARGGRSRTQLGDYVEVLQRKLEGLEKEVSTMQEQLQDQALLAVAMGIEGSPLGAAMPPVTHDATSLHHCSNAVKAERLVQVACIGDAAAVSRCLEQGADPDAVAWGGVTALMGSARIGSKAVMQVLLLAGADVNRTDARGRTAIDHAFKRPRAVEWLRQWGGLSCKELKMQADRLAQKVREVETERARIKALEGRTVVLKRAASTRRSVDPSPLPGSTPSAGDFRLTSEGGFGNVRPPWRSSVSGGVTPSHLGGLLNLFTPAFPAHTSMGSSGCVGRRWEGGSERASGYVEPLWAGDFSREGVPGYVEPLWSRGPPLAGSACVRSVSVGAWRP